MASGENLEKLFKAFKENNQVEFSKVAYNIIEEEKKKIITCLLTNYLEFCFMIIVLYQYIKAEI